MGTPLLEWPSLYDWERIYEASAFDTIFSPLESLQPARNETGDDFRAFTRKSELDGLLFEVHQRLVDSARSYVLMMFYYGKGIPDARWRISPGRKGQSIEFFPDFEERHFAIKAWFDFFSDTLYYKLFSAWDVLGHVLNVKYDLRAERVDFGQAVKALKSKEPGLHAKLAEVRESAAFQKANKLRNDITHNYLPNTTGFTVRRSGTSISVGSKAYVPSGEIVANIQETLPLFAATLQYVLGSDLRAG